MSKDTLTLVQKPALMAKIGTDYAVILMAEEEVKKMGAGLATQIKPIVDSFGPGPHKMQVPTSVPDPENPGQTKVENVEYQVRFTGAFPYSIKAVRSDSIT